LVYTKKTKGPPDDSLRGVHKFPGETRVRKKGPRPSAGREKSFLQKGEPTTRVKKKGGGKFFHRHRQKEKFRKIIKTPFKRNGGSGLHNKKQERKVSGEDKEGGGNMVCCTSRCTIKKSKGEGGFVEHPGGDFALKHVLFNRKKSAAHKEGIS